MGARQVTVYSTPGCSHCKAAKRFLESHNVPYRDIDVAADRVARQEMVARSGSISVPVIDVDGTVVVGFHEAELKEKLGL